MAEVKLELEYTRSLGEDRATLKAAGKRFDDDAARALVAALVEERCGNLPDEPGSVWRRKGDEYVVCLSVTFDVDGDDDLELYDTAVDCLLPEEGGLDADGCEVVAVLIDGRRHRPEDLNGLDVSPAVGR